MAGLRLASKLVVVLAAAGCVLELEPAGSPIGVAEQAVIGGEASRPGDYAATGALVRGRAHRCTATLIAPDVAITAAHCLADVGFGDFGFTLDADLTDEIENLVPVTLTHQHPDFEEIGRGDEYEGTARRNDIAVLILERRIEDVPFERLDRADQPCDLAPGTEVHLCGYGRDSWSVPETSGRKRDAILVVDHATPWELQTTPDGAQACKGDSGGPLFVESPSRRRIAGLVSRGAGASNRCDSGAIYTRVSPYVDWIEEASRDRDPGCSAAGRGGGALPVWLVCAMLAGMRWRGTSPRDAQQSALPPSRD